MIAAAVICNAAALMGLIEPIELGQLTCWDSSNGRNTHSPDRQTPVPIGGSVRDKELYTLNIELAELSLEKQREKVAQKRGRFARFLREGIERASESHTEEIQREQEKEGTESAKIAAEAAARQRIEEERRTEEERRKQHAEALARAEREVRQKLEKEAAERKQRQGLRGLFARSLKSQRPLQSQ